MSPCCRNCRHHVSEMVSVHLHCELREDRCAKFGKLHVDPIRGDRVENMPCEQAMRYYCGLGDWEPKPTLRQRIKGFFQRQA